MQSFAKPQGAASLRVDSSLRSELQEGDGIGWYFVTEIYET
jgi:hypothetical protein